LKALVVPRHGGPEVLEWQDLAEPTPQAGDVLVRVAAVAVDWADLLIREGRYPGAIQPPFVSGHNLVGEVVGWGENVSDPPLGTRVFGAVPRHGVAAEVVAVPRNRMHVAPDDLSDEEAAGLAGQFFTADIAIVTFGRLQPGETVLVHAAGGSFGSAAVQLCRAYGAGVVIATAGTQAKLDCARRCGADVVVDYTAGDFVAAVDAETRGRGVDLVLESVGGDVLGRSFDCLARMGRLVSVGASSGRGSDRFRLHTILMAGISVAGFSLGMLLQERPDVVDESAARVLAVIREQGIRPVVARVFGPDEAVEAHRFLQGRHSVGRTVMRLHDQAQPRRARAGAGMQTRQDR
jgi:NADPH2:quinone reductase